MSAGWRWGTSVQRWGQACRMREGEKEESMAYCVYTPRTAEIPHSFLPSLPSFLHIHSVWRGKGGEFSKMKQEVRRCIHIQRVFSDSRRGWRPRGRLRRCNLRAFYLCAGKSLSLAFIHRETISRATIRMYEWWEGRQKKAFSMTKILQLGQTKC
jgi:hypothetical protein